MELEEDAEDVVVEIPHFRAPVLDLYLDGEEKSLVAYAPHKGSLGSVKKGLHKVRIELYGNRFNGFGTLHIQMMNLSGMDMTHTVTKGSQWSDTYQLRKNGVLSPVNVHISK